MLVSVKGWSKFKCVCTRFYSDREYLILLIKGSFLFLFLLFRSRISVVKSLINILFLTCYWIGQEIHSVLFCTNLWKNMNEPFGQPSISI